MKKLVYILLMLVMAGCSLSNKCEDYICSTPPPSYNFEIVDAETGENLFTNETLFREDIQLKDDENRNIDWQFISENNRNIINLHIGWEEGLNSYTLILAPELEIEINIQSQKKTENCCTFYEISEFSISPFEWEQSPTTGIYRIKI